MDRKSMQLAVIYYNDLTPRLPPVFLFPLQTSVDAQIPVALALGKIGLLYGLDVLEKNYRNWFPFSLFLTPSPSSTSSSSSSSSSSSTSSSSTPETGSEDMGEPVSFFLKLLSRPFELFEEVVDGLYYHLGPDWDLYVITMLAVFLGVIAALRRRGL